MRVGWRCTTAASGAQSVMTSGMTVTPRWCADNWALGETYTHTHTRTHLPVHTPVCVSWMFSLTHLFLSFFFFLLSLSLSLSFSPSLWPVVVTHRAWALPLSQIGRPHLSTP